MGEQCCKNNYIIWVVFKYTCLRTGDNWSFLHLKAARIWQNCLIVCLKECVSVCLCVFSECVWLCVCGGWGWGMFGVCVCVSVCVFKHKYSHTHTQTHIHLGSDVPCIIYVLNVSDWAASWYIFNCLPRQHILMQLSLILPDQKYATQILYPYLFSFDPVRPRCSNSSFHTLWSKT